MLIGMKYGNVFVISAPSGAGKSSLVKALCCKDPRIKVSVSHTTRNKRYNEIDGTDYFFIKENVFEKMLENGQFLEHATVYGNHYGTSKNTVNSLIENNYDVILEIDWQGAYQIRQILPTAILIYILPPGLQELETRLHKRNTDSEEVIRKRLKEAMADLSHAKDFDFAVINGDFTTSLEQIYSIITVCRLKAKYVLENYVF